MAAIPPCDLPEKEVKGSKRRVHFELAVYFVEHGQVLSGLELQPSPSSPTPLPEACDFGGISVKLFKSFLWWLPIEAVTLLLRGAG